MKKKPLTKKEIQQIIALGFEERRKIAKQRSAKNSQAVKNWKNKQKEKPPLSKK